MADTAANELRDPRVAIRSTYGWQGANGTANTITAFCSECNRRVTVRTVSRELRILNGVQDRFDCSTAELFHNRSTERERRHNALTLVVDMDQLHRERIERDEGEPK